MIPELFEPGEYLNQHGPGYFAVAGIPDGKWKQHTYELHLLPRVVDGLNPNLDTWISQASFESRNRRSTSLQSVGLLFVDLDTYNRPDLRGLPPEVTTAKLLSYCREEGLPEPSIVMFSGRGLQAKWLLSEAVGRETVKVWEHAESALVRAFDDFGADRNAKDVSRVLRLDRTVNTKSGEVCRVVHVTGGVEDCPARYDFKQLCRILGDKFPEYVPEPYQPGEAAPRATRHRNVVAGSFTWQNLAWNRLCDLQRLWKLRGGVPEGYREITLFYELNFLLQAKPGRTRDIWKEAQSLAGAIDRENSFYRDSDLSTLYRKAQANLAGEKVDFQGRPITPLYTPRNTTLLQRFEVTPEEEQHLTSIISKAEKERRRIEKRRAAGVKPRDEYAVLDRTRPWEAMGISRAWYYVLRKRGDLPGVDKCGAYLGSSPQLSPILSGTPYLKVDTQREA